MGLSLNHRNFPHVKEVLDEAALRGGLRYTLQSDKAAVRWRMTAYHVRKLMQKEAQETVPKGVTAPTAYDGMYLTLDGATVIIQFNVKAEGSMTTLDGIPVNEKTKRFRPPSEPDELVEVADEVKKNLGL